MQLHLHQTHDTIGDFDGIFVKLKEVLGECRAGCHFFCEYFLTGHPLADLCLQKSFIARYKKHLLQINNFSLGLKKREDIVLLLGGLEYNEGKIKNVVYKLCPAASLQVVHTKILLPNYDIFDEKRYYHSGDDANFIRIFGKNIGLLLCEDMWYSTIHGTDQNPIQLLKNMMDEKGQALDLIVNFSASPYHVDKIQARIKRAQYISRVFSAPFAYINRVGGEDGILFDGYSFITDENMLLAKLSPFKAETQSIEFPQKKISSYTQSNPYTDGKDICYREFIFRPYFQPKTRPPQIAYLSEENCDEILKAIIFGIREYAKKTGLYNLLVAVSGGIDSALVLTLAKLSLKKGQKLEAIYMPSEFSGPYSTKLSSKLCKNLDVNLFHFPIKFLHSVMRHSFLDYLSHPLDGVSDENIQCRLRANILYTRSNQIKAMVLNTSNKSELAVGYSTLYGDSVGAVSPLGDLYKSEVYWLADYINAKHGNLIPKDILERPPTAELKHNQKDSQSLPPYEKLDAILEGLLSYDMDCEDFINMGFDPKNVYSTFHRYHLSEHKRRQFCPIIKLKPKSLGLGHRVPICKVFTL